MKTDNSNSENKEIERIVFLNSVNPASQTILPGNFPITTESEINIAAEQAHESWKTYKNISGKHKAIFLNTIADEIMGLGEKLILRAVAESGLSEGRIKSERERTCNQLRLFARLIEEGSWVNAIIDEAKPEHLPVPKVDLRKMSVAIGPVAVFTASNFPLAFSTAGGDTASALASGCPVIVKAHPSHLGTNALVAEAIGSAVQKCSLPKSVFCSLQGNNEIGQKLVKHPLVKAVGFTGSFEGGRAIFDIASKRAEPIPVYAEMGSNNPIFILQEKLEAEFSSLATNIAGSVNLGAGQFCTNPGILVLENTDFARTFLVRLETAFSKLQSGIMLNEGIYNTYNNRKKYCSTAEGVSILFERKNENLDWKGTPAVATISAKNFFKNKNLHKEVFGPFTLVVLCDDSSEVMEVASNLQGQLTATIMATAEELGQFSELVEVLSQKAGRVIFNGLPTGVEVGYAMHHGGPYPSTSNAMFTSVGTDAIQRFVRPVCYQNLPNQQLPDALKQENPLNIFRTVNGAKGEK